MDQRTRKGLGSRIRSGDIAAGVSVFRRPPSLPSPFASQRGVRIGLHEFWHWPHRSSFPAGEREMIPRNGSGPIKLEELVPIRRGNGPRGVGPAGPCFASAPLPVHDAPASGPGDPTVSAIAGREPSQPDLGGRPATNRARARWDRQRAVFESVLVRK